MNGNLMKLDGVLWDASGVVPKSYCPKHRLEMDAYTLDKDYASKPDHECSFNHLRCEECEKYYKIPRDIKEESEYIRRKIKAKQIKDLKVINFDDEAIPLAEDKVVSPDKKYFVKAILTESKVGLRLVVYAGRRGSKNKTQIFVEPAIKRLAFDQGDTHPAEIFQKLEAYFADGTSSTIKKK